MEPLEIIMSPFEVYLAPVGTAFPDVDTTPAGDWALLGVSGNLDHSEEGITVTHTQEFARAKSAGGTGTRKVSRTGSGLTISLSLQDVTLEAYTKALNNETVSVVAAGSGTPGYKKLPLYNGHTVSTFALLCRGVSPYGETYQAQYQVPVVFQAENPAPVFSKSGAAMLKFTFEALEDPNAATADARYGYLIDQNAAAT